MLKVSFPPFVRAEDTTRTLMSDVLIALLPSLVWAVYIFGYRALTVCFLSVLSSVIFEFAACKILKRANSIGDISSCVSGLVFAFLLPVSAPLWIVVVGALILTAVKFAFGGLGKNIVNPALSAEVILMICFPNIMTAFTAPFDKLPVFDFTVSDITRSATSLEYLASGTLPKGTLFDLLIGNSSGTIGEVSALLLIAGGIYLLVRGIIKPHIPLAYIACVAVLTYIFTKSTMPPEFMLSHLFSGSLMLGAFFMACDFSTAPMTSLGKIIYGVGCGALTVLFRYIGIFAEGVPFAIIVMNFSARWLDAITRPKIKRVAEKVREE